MQSRHVSAWVLASFIAVSSAAGTAVAADDDPVAACAEAVSLYKDDDVEGALEEARWCVSQLEQIRQNSVASFFRDEIAGYQGGELSNQQAMGISMIERSYTNGDQQIDVSLTGGASANNAFAALAQMGMSSGMGQKVRIQKRTGTLTDENGTVTVMVSLKSGGMLQFESYSASSDEVVEFANAFPVADLDDATGQ